MQKREKKKLVVGRRFMASGGKSSRNVKMVDARTRSDTRGEKNAAKKQKDRGKAKGSRQSKGKKFSRR